MARWKSIAAATAFAAGGLVGVMIAGGWLGYRGDVVALAPHPVWIEMPWPFTMDQWGRGKAFQCKAADCGTQIYVYVRAKIGFCNCKTGVADDEELERLSDVGLVGGHFAARGDGRPVIVAWMKGRSRAYANSAPDRSLRSAISIALNDHCDAIVTTVVFGHDRPADIEPEIMALLNGKTVLRWVEVALGL